MTRKSIASSVSDQMGKLVAHAKLISALTATRMTPTVAKRYKDAHAPSGEASSWGEPALPVMVHQTCPSGVPRSDPVQACTAGVGSSDGTDSLQVEPGATAVRHHRCSGRRADATAVLRPETPLAS